MRFSKFHRGAGGGLRRGRLRFSGGALIRRNSWNRSNTPNMFGMPQFTPILTNMYIYIKFIFIIYVLSTFSKYRIYKFKKKIYIYILCICTTYFKKISYKCKI